MSNAPAAVQPAPSPSVLTPIGWWRTFGRAPRIMGLDVARALAVLGMVGAHIGVTEEFELLNPGTWDALVHGRSSILFAVLAGVSIALMTGRTVPPERAQLPSIRLSLIGRGAVIFIIGILLELLGTPIAVILTVYGLLYVAAIPFLRWRPRNLLLAAGVLAIAGPPLLALLGAVTLGASGPGVDLVVFGTYPITVWMAFVLAGLAIGRMPLQRIRAAVSLLLVGIVLAAIGYGVGAIAEHRTGMTDADSSVVDEDSSSSWTEEDSLLDEEFWGEGDFGVPPEDIDFNGAICDDYGDGTYYCYPAEEPLPAEEDLEAVESEGWGMYPQALAEQAPGESMLLALVTSSPHSGGSAEIIGSGGFAIAVIGLCLLLVRPLRWVLLPLAALGSMPLTAYTGHILVIFALAGPGLLLGGDEAWAWLSITLIVGATFWAMFLGRGPLEWLVGRAATAMASGAQRGSAADKPTTPVVG